MGRLEPFVVREQPGGLSSFRTGSLLFALVFLGSIPFMLRAALRGEVGPVVATLATLLVVAVAVAAVRAAAWLRAYDGFELVIDAAGIAVSNRNDSRRFGWSELIDVAFTNKVPAAGGRPALVIESTKVCDPNPGYRTRCVREFMGRLPNATVIPMRACDPATRQAIAHAIAEHSRGRFPGPYRREIQMSTTT